jgi:chitin elicitor receptor kinase 1
VCIFVHTDEMSDIFLTSMGYDVCRYARYGDISPKVDVYAFGVVLYELISSKNAIVRSAESVSDSKGLVYLVIVLLNQLCFCTFCFKEIRCKLVLVTVLVPQLPNHFLLDDSLAPITILKLQFEEALSRPDPKEGLEVLIDLRLGEDYPMESILKVSRTTYRLNNVAANYLHPL